MAQVKALGLHNGLLGNAQAVPKTNSASLGLPRRLLYVSASQEKPVEDKGWFATFLKDKPPQSPAGTAKNDSAVRKGEVGTLFDDSFKYTAWVEVFFALTKVGQKSIPPAEAYEMRRRNKAVLLDVREAQDYKKYHAEGAVNAPLFRLIQGSSLRANLRRLGYALLTDFAGTERDPSFVENALEAVGGGKRKAVIVMCLTGGTLNTSASRIKNGKAFRDPDKFYGLASRSLKACYELRQAGFTNVYHLKGGLNLWAYEDFPTV